MITNNKFDEKIKNCLDTNRQLLVNKQLVWEQIEARLDKEKSAKKRFLIAYHIAACLIALIVLYGVLPKKQSSIIVLEKRLPVIPVIQDNNRPDMETSKFSEPIVVKQRAKKTQPTILKPIVERIELANGVNPSDGDSAVNLQVDLETIKNELPPQEQPTKELEIVTVEVRYASPNKTVQNKKLLVDINNLMIGVTGTTPEIQLVNETIDNKSRLRINNF